MFLALYSITPFPAPCAAYGSGCPGKRIWNAKCYACTSYSGCLSPVGRSPSGNQPCGYRRRTIPADQSPAPVPIRPLRTCSCFLCPANMCTGRMTNDHLLNLLSFLFASFPPRRCETISPGLTSFPQLSAKLALSRISLTSCQVGTKLTPDCSELPANLAGS